MHRLQRAVMTGAATAAFAVSTALPAAAIPRPRADEWWTQPKSWGITNLVWPMSKGNGVIVAILDSGVDAGLPDLPEVVLPGGDTTGAGSDGRQDFQSDGHGTAMAALMGAQGTGTSRFVGVAPEARILPVHVADGKHIISSSKSFAAGIRFAVDHDAKIISISQVMVAGQYAEHCAPDVQEAVAYAAEHDVMVVAAAGNDGAGLNPAYSPAGCAGVVAVGAVDSTGRPWSKTERQDYVTIAAPGVDVGWVGKDRRYYPHQAGTSQATALTSGALALVRSAHPDWSARTIVQRMIATASPTGTTTWNDRSGYGIFRVNRVIDPKYHVFSNAPNPVYQRLDQWTSRQAKSAPKSAAQPEKQAASNTPLVVVAAVAGAVVLLGALLTVMIRRRRHNPPFTT